MPKPPTRKRRKEARPDEILEAALDRFTARGFRATRMDDIAARAGVSKGTIYLYYPSKQAIFEALVRAKLIPNLERVAERLAQNDAPPDVQLGLILEAVGTIVADPRRVAIPKLVIAEAGNFPEMARFYRREVIGRGIALIEGIVRRGQATGRFRAVDPHLAARLFVAPILMTALWQATFAQAEDRPVAPTELLALHTAMFLRAMAAEPTGERR